MIRVIFAFLVIMASFHFAIETWRYATQKERWSWVKTLTYSLFLAIITSVAMTLLVIFF